jgi:predicted aconitase
MLDGAQGPAVQTAMRILLRMGELQGSSRFIPIQSVHVDGCLYEGDAILDFVERLRDLGGQVRVPTTLNAISVEYGSWRRLGIPEEYGLKATRIVDAYLGMGARPSFSCAPYQTGHVPQAGSDVAWAESNAIAFANSVLGARTARYGDFLDI